MGVYHFIALRASLALILAFLAGARWLSGRRVHFRGHVYALASIPGSLCPTRENHVGLPIIYVGQRGMGSSNPKLLACIIPSLYTKHHL